jgi:hypothetical protein
MARTQREYTVGHSHRGFTLEARDYPLVRWLVGEGVEWLLGSLGHPCCGRGLGRIGPVFEVSHRALEAAVNWQRRSGERVAAVRLTTEQALALQPRFAEDTGPDGWITVNGEDEDGDVWSDAVLIGVRCEDCHQVIDAAGRWSAIVLKEHAYECSAAGR